MDTSPQRHCYGITDLLMYCFIRVTQSAMREYVRDNIPLIKIIREARGREYA